MRPLTGAAMNRLARNLLLGAAAVSLAACGGGGVNSTPTPTPAPAPLDPIFNAVITSQQFAAAGASHSYEGDQGPQLAAGEQLQVRYVESSNSYEVQLPHSETWTGISYFSSGVGEPTNFGGPTADLYFQGDYRYSRLFQWSDNGSTVFGYEAIGMATPANGIPVTGSADYAGRILGSTSEIHPEGDMSIKGDIALSFNFGLGSLSGNINPVLQQDFAPYSLGTTDFRDTVYSAGGTTFAGKFDTNVAGLNSFSGQFAGPNAQELIGNFALPYVSPIDSQTYQADGAFVAKK